MRRSWGHSSGGRGPGPVIHSVLVHEDLGPDPGAHLGRGLAVGCELDCGNICQCDIIMDITVIHQPMVDD